MIICDRCKTPDKLLNISTGEYLIRKLKFTLQTSDNPSSTLSWPIGELCKTCREAVQRMVVSFVEDKK